MHMLTGCEQVNACEREKWCEASERVNGRVKSANAILSPGFCADTTKCYSALVCVCESNGKASSGTIRQSCFTLHNRFAFENMEKKRTASLAIICKTCSATSTMNAKKSESTSQSLCYAVDLDYLLNNVAVSIIKKKYDVLFTPLEEASEGKRQRRKKK